MRARIALISFLVVACGKKEPTELEKEVATAKAACDKGDGAQCFVEAAPLDPTKPDQLRRAKALWTRGCELRHAPSCAQLGTIAEFGMESGGATPDMQTANMYYALACKLGDKQTCDKLGIVPAPSP